MFKRRLRQSPGKLRGLDRPSFRARADRRGRDDEGGNNADFFPRPDRPSSARSVFPLLGRPRAKSDDHPTIASRRDPLPALNAAAVQAEWLYCAPGADGQTRCSGTPRTIITAQKRVLHTRRTRFFHARKANDHASKQKRSSVLASLICRFCGNPPLRARRAFFPSASCLIKKF